jgi:hypothetical protein
VVPLASKVQLEPQVFKVVLASKEPQAPLVLLALLVQPASKVLQDQLESPVQQALLDQVVPLDHKVIRQAFFVIKPEQQPLLDTQEMETLFGITQRKPVQPYSVLVT